MAEFTNDHKWTAGRGTTALGIIGTALGGLAVAGNGLVGGGMPTNTGDYVTKESLEAAGTIAELRAENALLAAGKDVDAKLLTVYNTIDDKINRLTDKVYAYREEQSGINTQQAVWNASNTAVIGCMQTQINTLLGMTKTVIPNGSVCPGWGTATVSVTTDATTTA